MDQDLKDTLIMVLQKLIELDTRVAKMEQVQRKRSEEIEERLKQLEAVAHKQITEDDLIKRYKDFVMPNTPGQPMIPRPVMPMMPAPRPSTPFGPDIVPAPWDPNSPIWAQPHDKAPWIDPHKVTAIC